MNKKVIIAFGGSFNPPTNAHFSLAQQLADEYDFIEKILFIPVGDHYEKRELLPAKYRIEMLERVCSLNSKFGVSTVEVDADRQLYTIETLELLQRKYPDNRIWFTVGTDNLKQIPKWKEYEALISKFQLLVLERDTDRMHDIIEENPELKCYEHNFIRVKETVRSNCSSTIIREKIRDKKSVRYLVPDEVYYYITHNHLYDERKEV